MESTMTFSFTDLLKRAAEHEGREFTTDEFIHYADELLTDAGNYRDQYLSEPDKIPTWDECLTETPFTYDELCFVSEIEPAFYDFWYNWTDFQQYIIEWAGTYQVLGRAPNDDDLILLHGPKPA